MRTINIKKSAVVGEFLSNINRAGSTEWDIYVDSKGRVDCRHNTHSNGEWTEVVDLYNCTWDNIANDEETFDWLMSDGFDWRRMEVELSEVMEENSEMIEDDDGDYVQEKHVVNFI